MRIEGENSRPVELLPRPENRKLVVWGYFKALHTLQKASPPAALGMQPQRSFTAYGISQFVNMLQIHPIAEVLQGSGLDLSLNQSQNALLVKEGRRSETSQVQRYLSNSYLPYGILQERILDSNVTDSSSKDPEYEIHPAARNFSLYWFRGLCEVVADNPKFISDKVFPYSDMRVQEQGNWFAFLSDADRQGNVFPESNKHVSTLLNDAAVLRMRIIEELAEATRDNAQFHLPIIGLVNNLQANYDKVHVQIKVLENLGILSHELIEADQYQWKDVNKIPFPQRLTTQLAELTDVNILRSLKPLPLGNIATRLAERYPKEYGYFIEGNEHERIALVARIKRVIMSPIKEELPMRMMMILRTAKQTDPNRSFTTKQLCSQLAQEYPQEYGEYATDSQNEKAIFEKRIIVQLQRWQDGDSENNFITQQKGSSTGGASVYFIPKQRVMSFQLVNAFRFAESHMNTDITADLPTIFPQPEVFRQVLHQEYEAKQTGDAATIRSEIIDYLLSHVPAECTAEAIGAALPSRQFSASYTSIILGELEKLGAVEKSEYILVRRSRNKVVVYQLTPEYLQDQQQNIQEIVQRGEVVEQVNVSKAEEIPIHTEEPLEYDRRKLFLQTLDPVYMARYEHISLSEHVPTVDERLSELPDTIRQLIQGRGVIELVQRERYQYVGDTDIRQTMAIFEQPVIHIFGTLRGDQEIARILQSIGTFTELDKSILFDPSIPNPIRVARFNDIAYYFISPIQGNELIMKSKTKSNAPPHLQKNVLDALQMVLDNLYLEKEQAYQPVSDAKRVSLDTILFSHR